MHDMQVGMAEKVTSFFGPDYSEASVGRIALLAEDTPFRLASGKEIHNFPIAYQSWGTLNADKSNAVLVCHALTGDQYVIGEHPVTGRSGWWEQLIGPGRAVDTDRYFVLCSNVLGSCMGSFGPKHTDAESGRPYGLSFPVVTIGDMVRAQALLLDKLGIEQLACVIGGSMGGMQVLEWAARFPQRVRAAIPIATGARHTAQNIAFHEIGRQAIMADPDWCEGDYLTQRKFPAKGLAVARMAAHVTYLSEFTMHRKFGRELQDRDEITYGFEADFQVESYLRHQGKAFVDRFDPNAYLYITRAMDYFDLARDHGGGKLANVFKRSETRFCVVSFSTDWLFPTSESLNIVRALSAVAGNVSFVEIQSDRGHDAFLLDEPELRATVGGFLGGVA